MSKRNGASENRIIKTLKTAGKSLTDFFALIGRKIYKFLSFERVNGKDAPVAMPKRIGNAKKIAAMLGVLLLTLIVVIIVLHACSNIKSPHTSVDIPGNVIDPDDEDIKPEAALKLGGDLNENLPFKMEEMSGGSSETLFYRLIASGNSDFILKYDMIIRDNEEFQKLAEILKIKVELTDTSGTKVVYDGLMAWMPTLEFTLNGGKETEYLFGVTVYLDETLDEQYYAQKLMADMRWWIDGQDSVTVPNCEFSTVATETPPDPPVIVPELSIVKLNAGDNTSFDMEEIREGAYETKYFAFEVAHSEDVVILIESDVLIDSVLGNVLTVKVELVGADGSITLFEGLLRELLVEHTVSANTAGKTTLYYRVTVTAKGLSSYHRATKLVCDLSWSVAGTSEQIKVSNNSFVAYTPPYNPPSVPETATSIELSDKDGFDVIPFDSDNMMPGGNVVNNYCITLTHKKSETVRFSVELDKTQKLSKVLRIKVEQLVPDSTDKILYDGLMKNCVDIDVNASTNTSTVTQIYYRVTVYTNGAEVGNEYIGESLSADFVWEIQ